MSERGPLRLELANIRPVIMKDKQETWGGQPHQEDYGRNRPSSFKLLTMCVPLYKSILGLRMFFESFYRHLLRRLCL